MPAKTVAVNKRREPFDVYIGRGPPWGNPFRIGPDGPRILVIAKYINWVTHSDDEEAQWICNHVTELKDKRLGCYCAPLACHGDFLAVLADYGGFSELGRLT